MAEMNPHVKRKWVRALRSGEYEQADGTLVNGSPEEASYCCLAVLLAEARPESFYVNKAKYPSWESSYLEVKESETHFDDENGQMDLVADDLAILYGVDFDTQKVLAEMNDTHKPFSAIADYIEENL